MTTQQTDDHRLADVETIVVNPEDVIETMYRNRRDEHAQRSHVLRITPAFEGRVEAEMYVSEQGNRYPSNITKPVHLSAQSGVSGEHPHNGQLPEDATPPSRARLRSVTKDDLDIDPDKPLDAWTEEEQEYLEELTEIAEEEFETRVRANLADEIECRRPDGTTTTVSVEYEEGDA